MSISVLVDVLAMIEVYDHTASSISDNVTVRPSPGTGTAGTHAPRRYGTRGTQAAPSMTSDNGCRHGAGIIQIARPFASDSLTATGAAPPRLLQTSHGLAPDTR
jgi:hypothetical protein